MSPAKIRHISLLMVQRSEVPIHPKIAKARHSVSTMAISDDTPFYLYAGQRRGSETSSSGIYVPHINSTWNTFMPIIQIEVQISAATLLEAALQLGPRELDEFATRLQTLRAGRSKPTASSRVPVLSQEESALLLVVNQGLPLDERAL